mmetsp:Transcript_17919/g.19946  ORF Transcript_17919/g.19946 Transcript_17919/m.19946 type:complete len:465 (+) Transcript_17919:33-1427(+)
MGNAQGTGAKGTTGFVVQVDKGVLPPPSSITYEGMFYNHYFDIGPSEKEKHFNPRFFKSQSRNPISGEIERHICVGLSGKLDGQGLYELNERWPINVVIALDVSNSMNSLMCANGTKTAIAVAKDSLVGLLPNLKDNDKLGIILFDRSTEVLLPLTTWSDVNTEMLKFKISKITTRYGTNLQRGFAASKKMLEDALTTEKREQRIIFFTDMKITRGRFAYRLQSHFISAAKKDVYTTFVGIGDDFDTGAVEIISKTRGSNYFTVRTPKEFNALLQTEFDYITTCNCHDIEIGFESKKVWARRIYGSPGFEKPQSGILCKMASSCPSRSDDLGRMRGSVVLVEIRNHGQDLDETLCFNTSYTTRTGDHVQIDSNISFTSTNSEEEYFENNCIRKTVLLARYVNLIKSFLQRPRFPRDWLTTFDTFKKYMEKEMEILSSDDEEALTKELELFETIHQIIKEKQRKR